MPCYPTAPSPQIPAFPRQPFPTAHPQFMFPSDIYHSKYTYSYGHSVSSPATWQALTGLVFCSPLISLVLGPMPKAHIRCSINACQMNECNGLNSQMFNYHSFVPHLGMTSRQSSYRVPTMAEHPGKCLACGGIQ